MPNLQHYVLFQHATSSYNKFFIVTININSNRVIAPYYIVRNINRVRVIRANDQ